MNRSSTAVQPIFEVAVDYFDRTTVLSQYLRIRRQTEDLCQPLATEDYCIQSMADVSPPKWHIAHISWFFEAFILKHFDPKYQEYNPRFDYLFNSYYVTHGQPFPREQRGQLSRPTVDEVYCYRAHVDQAMMELIENIAEEHWLEFAERVTLGLHHEQQHQELLLTDIKHILAFNPLHPAYRDDLQQVSAEASPLQWLEMPGGIATIGHSGEGFAFDNETPRHQVYSRDYALASRPVSNGEYMEFVAAGGYQQPQYWLSAGWSTVNQQAWKAPLYWQEDAGRWWQMTLGGMRLVDEHAPVCHISLFEADAYARWVGKRLPSEAEWEWLASRQPMVGNLRETDCLQPMPVIDGSTQKENPVQIFGDVWEWTQSAYAPYPGFKTLDGTLGEYNGKFMCSQLVLRGGSCVTPRSHIRASYRNFFYPGDRWQFTGIRLADDR